MEELTLLRSKLESLLEKSDELVGEEGEHFNNQVKGCLDQCRLTFCKLGDEMQETNHTITQMKEQMKRFQEATEKGKNNLFDIPIGFNFQGLGRNMDTVFYSITMYAKFPFAVLSGNGHHSGSSKTKLRVVLCPDPTGKGLIKKTTRSLGHDAILVCN